jgi:hypothetical protein
LTVQFFPGFQSMEQPSAFSSTGSVSSSMWYVLVNTCTRL